MARSRSHEVFTKTVKRARQMFDFSLFLCKQLEIQRNKEEGNWDEEKAKQYDISTELPTSKVYNNYPMVTDMGRAAIVIAVSAMDEYFTRRFAICVVPLLKQEKSPKKLISFLEEAGLDVPGSLELLSMQRPYRRIRKLVDNHLSNHVTQRFKKIDDLYSKISVNNFTKGIEKRAKRKTLLASVRKLVDRRHFIAHSGDLNRSRKLRTLDPKEVSRRLDDLILLVDSADEIVNERLK